MDVLYISSRLHNLSLLIESNALAKSIDIRNSGFFLLKLSCMQYCNMNSLTVIRLFLVKPACSSFCCLISRI